VIGGLVLAAGQASRFGSAKQLAILDGRPLLEHAVRAITASVIGRVIVVLGAGAEEVIAGVDLHGAEPLVCERRKGRRRRSPVGSPSYPTARRSS
jgi:CTP:molybdopterin cytidylyltransferase MocA